MWVTRGQQLMETVGCTPLGNALRYNDSGPRDTSCMICQSMSGGSVGKFRSSVTKVRSNISCAVMPGSISSKRSDA